MNVADAIRNRKSTRAFLPCEVTEAQLRELLEVARWSPSGGNTQPWQLYALSGSGMSRFQEAFKAEMATNPRGDRTEFPIYPEGLKEPYRTRRYVCGEALYASIGIPREDTPGRLRQLGRNYEFFGATAAVFFTIDRQMGLGQWAHLGMLMQSVALVAESIGLATCMQEAWMTRHSFLRRFFEIPEHLQTYAGIAIGYADDSAPINQWRTERAPLDEFVIFAK